MLVVQRKTMGNGGNSMIHWGMVGNSHDASLAVFDNDKLLWASLSKDFSKVPNDPDFNVR